MATSAIKIISDIMKEAFPNAIEDTVAFDTDPILNGVFLNGKAVRPMGRSGVDTIDENEWEAIHVFRIAPGGVLNWRPISSSDVVESGDIANRFLNAGQSFPSALYATQSEYFKMGIPLSMCMGNVAANIKTLKSKKFATQIYDHVTGMIKDQVKLFKAHLQFSVYGDGSGQIATIGATTSTTGINAAGESVTITLKSSDGAIKGFTRNMLIDIYDSTGTTVRNTGGPMVVTAVDYLDNKLTLTLVKDQSGGTDITIDTTAGAEDQLYLWNSKDNLPKGLEYFIKNSGTLFKMSLSDYPELKSLISGNSGTLRSPTPDLINQFFDTLQQNGTGDMPDIMLSSYGVRSAYVKERSALVQYQIAPSQGDVVYDGGFAGLKYTYENNTFKWFVSGHLRRKNSLYLIRRSDIQLYAPEGTQKVQWFYANGGLSDADSIWSPVYNVDTTDNITKTSLLIEAPYAMYIQFATTAPQNLGRLDDLKQLEDLL